MTTPKRRKPPIVGDPAADHAVQVINNLTHTKGKFAGQPFNLREWQERDIIRQLFKTNPKTGLRQYRTCLLMLPRKNGKSEMAAAIAIYGLRFDKERGAEVYLAAADKDQASLVFNVMVQMIRHDRTLERQFEIIESQRRIVHRASGSMCRAISSEAYTKHGFNASMIIVDEVHALPDRELWDVLTTSQGAREQPLTLAISTAGYDRHSLLYELYAHAKNVQENPALDPTFLPILYEMPKDADWTDEREWYKCNPALGDFRSIEDMRIACDRAKAIPAQENTFRKLYCNQWTEQDNRWLSVASWDGCLQAVPLTVLKGRRCYVGMDLSTTTDLTAIVAVFPDEVGPGFDVLVRFFVPRDSMADRGRRDHVPYEQWSRDGYLDATPGNQVDYEAVRMALREWDGLFDVREIGFDPWNATDLVQRLQAQDGFTMAPIRQGFASLSAPTKALEKAILSRELRHGGHPVLRWNVSNVSVEEDAAGNKKISKKVSTERIDGVAALVMAIDVMHRNAGTKAPEYEVMFFGGASAR